MWKNVRFLWARYTVSVLGVGLALLLTLSLAPVEQPTSSPFFAAVMVSAWYGGLGPGLLATVLSAVVLDFLFLPPAYSPYEALADSVRLGLFVAVAVLISLLNAARKRRQEILRQQEHRKDEFLAVLAHELRNPLSPILHSMQFLRLSAPDDPATERSLDIVERQVRHLARLIEDLLDVSRISRGKIQLRKEPVDVVAAAAHAVETARPLIDARKHHLELSLPPGPVVLEADATRLEQIIVNLLTNAAKYTDPGGRIWLKLERTNGDVWLRVRDTGIGLPPEVLPRVFDFFMQAENGSQGGLGIGLSLVRCLVQMHGGTVTAASAGSGQGSEFVVRLPLFAQAPAG